jgi:hypothetical protein
MACQAGALSVYGIQIKSAVASICHPALFMACEVLDSFMPLDYGSILMLIILVANKLS